MSWSVSGTVEDLVITLPLGPAYQTEEVADAYNAAYQAIWNVVYSGAVGDPSGKYKVNVSGHANPDHVPTEGWADDFISINIYQAREEAK
jgi:hypothetical protein